MRFWLLILLACAACSIEERGAPGTDASTRLELDNATDSVLVRLAAPARARAGDAVPITITLQNGTARVVELALGGREIAFDIVVTRDNAIVWQRLFGQTVPAILQLKRLEPGESFQLVDAWQANVEPGTYHIVGQVLTDDAPLETAPARIEITRP